MSERKKSLFLTKEMWAQDSPPLENSAWIFKDSNARKKFTRKNDGKSKFDSMKIKIRLNVKNEKQTFLQHLTKNDESMISKKGARSSTVKEIIRELSESDDEQVWDRSFRFHDDIVFVQVWLFDALFLFWSHQWVNFFLKSSPDMLLNLDLKA